MTYIISSTDLSLVLDSKDLEMASWRSGSSEMYSSSNRSRYVLQNEIEIFYDGHC